MVELNINDYISLVGNFGFPLVLSFYLLFRMEKNIKELINVVINLQTYLEEEKEKNN